MSNVRRRLLNALLILSLATNLVVAGTVIARFSGTSDRPGRPFPPHARWITSGLSDEKRAELRPIIRGHEREVRGLRRDVGNTQREVRQLLMDDDFDEAQLTTALAALRSQSLSYQEASHRHMIDLSRHLTGNDRKHAMRVLARQANDPRRRSPGPRGRDGPPRER
jgi:uncharacterized membrane protein